MLAEFRVEPLAILIQSNEQRAIHAGLYEQTMGRNRVIVGIP
jgi:hypothetical protein